MEQIILYLFNQADTLENKLMQFWHWLNAEDDLVSIVIASHTILHPQPIVRDEDQWIDKYVETDFFSLFRMGKETFHQLLFALQLDLKEYKGGEFPISPEYMVLMSLWWLGKGETLISVADKFNVAIVTVFRCTEYVLLKIINNLTNKYIVWPDRMEVISIAEDFHARGGYPDVIGAVDGCNIRFKCPTEKQESYTDKNMNHSIKVQGIVTTQKIFTNIVVGFPGSVHDSRIFQNSKIFIDVEQNNRQHDYSLDNYHLVGDKAYPLRQWIMTPYRDNGHLMQRQRLHNLIHSRTRIVVEHTFGILKSRWRILKYINVNTVEKAIKIITACCTLHNYCFINRDYWDDYETEENPVENNHGQNDNIEGEFKRNEIANFLYNQ